jgi:hypothetical protein
VFWFYRIGRKRLGWPTNLEIKEEIMHTIKVGSGVARKPKAKPKKAKKKRAKAKRNAKRKK